MHPFMTFKDNLMLIHLLAVSTGNTFSIQRCHKCLFLIATGINIFRDGEREQHSVQYPKVQKLLPGVSSVIQLTKKKGIYYYLFIFTFSFERFLMEADCMRYSRKTYFTINCFS